MPRRAPVERRPLDPTRVRRIPGGFSWIDRRFIRDGWMDRLASDQILLYLFLATVADRFGLSWYSDPRIALLLGLKGLDAARSRLIERGLILHQAPLYQVLDLSPPPPRQGGLMSLGEILRGIAASGQEGR